MVKKLILRSIVLYQKTMSLDHGPLSVFFPFGFCKFSPTCSEYAHQSVNTKGIFIGIFCGLLRIVRCNPWSKGGNDPVV